MGAGSAARGRPDLSDPATSEASSPPAALALSASAALFFFALASDSAWNRAALKPAKPGVSALGLSHRGLLPENISGALRWPRRGAGAGSSADQNGRQGGQRQRARTAFGSR